MDLLSTLRDKIDRLPIGNHTAGLKAVLLHIQTAEAHQMRGQNGDESAFTDAIYRSNQAFEGSLKEAYRVLAEKTPEKKTPNQIEDFLTASDVFRRRVLSLMTSYRSEWRNPSVHDHKLDFDSNDAFLAIVSVCAFANLLLDQIAEKLARVHAKVQSESEKQRLASMYAPYANDFPLYLGNLVAQFMLDFGANPDVPRMPDSELLGALSGFLETVVPEVKAIIEFPLTEVGHEKADLLVLRNSDKLIIELKRVTSTPQVLQSAVEQIDRYADLSGISNALLIIDGAGNSVTLNETATSMGRRVIIIERSVGPE